jgi:thymidylate synthase
MEKCKECNRPLGDGSGGDRMPLPPKPPLSRLITEGTYGTCPECKSTEIKRFVFFGTSIGCIQPDLDYQNLLKDILENGVKKNTRNGEVLSIFGRQIRHKMSEGFPLLTTKKMAWKQIVVELLWFLRGSTNIKFLIENGCHIWDGDCYQAYLKHTISGIQGGLDRIAGYMDGCLVEFEGHYEHFSTNPSFAYGFRPHTQEEFINEIKTDDEFAKKWGDLGPVYGKQWRKWKIGERRLKWSQLNEEQKSSISKEALENTHYDAPIFTKEIIIDQIANLINDLKTNPDSRRLIVNSWNVGQLSEMVLPPCHYGFQVYTRELSLRERYDWSIDKVISFEENDYEKTLLVTGNDKNVIHKLFDKHNVPTRAISLMWNQRSVDTPLGLPFNIASYGLLLEIIAKAVNMVPDELIGNLGDTHIYLNQIDGVKEQIGRELSLNERIDLFKKQKGLSEDVTVTFNVDYNSGAHIILDEYNIPKRTREPFPLPKLNINTEWWPTQSGECGVGPIDAEAVFQGFFSDAFCKCLLEEDIQLADYQSHPSIKFPLSN